MTYQLDSTNAVIVAHQFNPSIISQMWLVRNGVAGEDDFGGGCIFTPVIVQVEARDFRLLVVPEQLQFAPKIDTEAVQALVESKVGAIVSALPHTPYRAVGINVNWHIMPEDEPFDGFVRRLFFREHSSLYSAFDQDDARFGSYLSKSMFGSRLKLDIKPIMVNTELGAHERLQLAFNFHRDVASENAVEEIVGHLAHWNEAGTYASNIVETLTSGGET